MIDEAIEEERARLKKKIYIYIYRDHEDEKQIRGREKGKKIWEI